MSRFFLVDIARYRDATPQRHFGVFRISSFGLEPRVFFPIRWCYGYFSISFEGQKLDLRILSGTIRPSAKYSIIQSRIRSIHGQIALALIVIWLEYFSCHLRFIKYGYQISFSCKLDISVWVFSSHNLVSTLMETNYINGCLYTFKSQLTNCQNDSGSTVAYFLAFPKFIRWKMLTAWFYLPTEHIGSPASLAAVRINFELIFRHKLQNLVYL